MSRRNSATPRAATARTRRLCSLPLNQCFQVEFTEKTLALPQIPDAWDGLSILHLTDLHLCGTPDRAFFHFVMEQCMKAGAPDLLLLTGDVVDSEWHHRWIVPVLGKLQWNLGAFAILGNHDSWRDVTLIRRRLRRVGMTVLGGGPSPPTPLPGGARGALLAATRRARRADDRDRP